VGQPDGDGWSVTDAQFFQVAIVVKRSAAGSVGVLHRSGITGGRVGRHANFSSGMGLSGCPRFSPYVK